MSSFLNNKNFQLGILITLACLVVLLISLNHKTMGFEIAILSVIAVILLTTYLVMHILSSNKDESTTSTENFACGNNKWHNNEVQENFANPVDKDDYQNMEHFDDHNDMWTVVNPNDINNNDFIKYLPTDQAGNSVGSLISGDYVNKDARPHVVRGTNIEVRKQELLAGQTKEATLREGSPTFATDQSGSLNISSIQKQLKETGEEDVSRVMETEKQRAAKRREGAEIGDVVRDQHADIKEYTDEELRNNPSLVPRPAPADSKTCGDKDGPGDKGVCLFEISTRDTCINRNSYDIRGACHIENKGPLPAPQPPKCPCDSQAEDKWKANMCKTLGNGVGCYDDSQDNCDRLWNAQYGNLFDTAGKDNPNHCWRSTGGLTEGQCGPGGEILNDLMPANN
tara:strand:+ start:264 stop:1454 length:1191 start_codon:yes stop_codon:yes gene_type:complete